jgi:hypothetical protein
LTVPQSGAETRQDIKDKKDFAISGVKEKSSKVADKVKGASCCGFAEKVKDKIKGGDDDEVVVEYTIRYDDEDEAVVDKSDDEDVTEEVEDVEEVKE